MEMACKSIFFYVVARLSSLLLRVARMKQFLVLTFRVSSKEVVGGGGGEEI